MRASPRTWPSIRFRRLSTDVLASGRMPAIYPYRVSVSRDYIAVDHSTHTHAASAAIDPVCGMKVDPAKSPHRHSHAQKAYHFCSAGCRGKFAADPDKYLGGAPGPAEVRPEDTVYTCPMHPEIRQGAPAS